MGPFLILAPSSGKLDAPTRKQVRSHVMRGKNRKHPKRRGNALVGSWINDEPPDAVQSSPECAPTQFIPPRVGHDLSHVPFVEEMNPHTLELIFKFFTVLKRAMYPVEACVQPSDGQWVEYLAYDRAYLSSTLCTTQSFFDYVRNATLSEKAVYHLNNTLQTLRENLADPYFATSDSTISTVLTLVILADVIDDRNAAKRHAQGLYQLVQLRGGIAALRHNRELQVKVLRADLGVAINAGSKPFFFSDGFSWEPYLIPRTTVPSPNTPPPANPTTNPSTPPTFPILITDPRLLNILHDLQEFSLAANLASQTGCSIPAPLFHETLVSVQYRLLALRDEDDFDDDSDHTHRMDASPARLLRLGMLAFSTTTFLQIQQLPLRYADLARRMRGCVRRLGRVGEASLSQEEARLALWFLFVATVSVLGGEGDEEGVVGAARRVAGGLGLGGVECRMELASR
ncbi:hypothetical protein C8A05DRAFT_42094 [Staphylotrichum tortipilum]|uniref:Uncharacterized protein n=1 Tax=Staphylotrichum tortipilum TaxID=2831512 RepID=A0AAN6MQW1_9PEZI|nr:hypothetical protein C8A05DRAFT_42094 [Staphylotrichum longicolle]